MRADPQTLRSCCALLCSKSGLVGDAWACLSDGSEPELADHNWCARTLTALGPDGEAVALVDCQPGRECHRRTVRS